MTEPGLLDPRFRCSDLARSRGDQLTGTAPPATRWLLIEYPGSWSVDALAGSRIDPEVQQLLRDACARGRVRLLLIRRSERTVASAPGRRLWTVLTRGAAEVAGDWSDDQDLRAAARAVDQPAPHLEADVGGDPARSTRPATRPMILVCAHGVHDVCCAVRGRPVARAIAARWPDQTWECSHVGGDRFAPNVVILPDGAYYGDLDPISGPSVVADHLAGFVRADHLRGLSGYPPPVQAAMNALYGRLDRSLTGQLRYLDHAAPDPDRWRVRFALIGPAPGVAPTAGSAVELTVDVQAGRAEPALLTCRAARPTSAISYRITAVEGLPASPE